MSLQLQGTLQEISTESNEEFLQGLRFRPRGPNPSFTMDKRYVVKILSYDVRERHFYTDGKRDLEEVKRLFPKMQLLMIAVAKVF